MDGIILSIVFRRILFGRLVSGVSIIMLIILVWLLLS